MNDRTDGMNGSAHEAQVVGGNVVVSEVPPELVEESLYDPTSPLRWLDPTVQRSLASWAEDTTGGATRRARGLFARDRYVTPGKVFEQMALAYDAVDDDIIGGILDSSESMAFHKIAFESDDEDQTNIWKQIGADLNLDNYFRQAFRELFIVSQFYGVRMWGNKTYKVKAKRETREARKQFNLVVPTELGFLDPTRVVPLSVDPFGNATLVWIGSDADMKLYEDNQKQSTQTDEVVSNLFLGPYEPTPKEKADLDRESIPVDNLLQLNPWMVWRHTLTMSSYERWARLRMKSVFPLLDMKHQLREMDRAFLLGGINFIILVSRGTDDRPATQSEVNEATSQMRTQSKSPVIVSDHRIKIELISPDVEHVLAGDKWAVLDERIMMRLWGMFALQGSNQDSMITLGRSIARGLQNRRHMLKRSMEKELIRAVIDVPANAKADFGAATKIEFAPRRIDLDLDPGLINMIQHLRDRGDLSRETTLQEFNFDQEQEAMRREAEDEKYGDPSDEDSTFSSVNVPFDAKDGTTPDGSGRTGGRPAGEKKPAEKKPAGEKKETK